MIPINERDRSVIQLSQIVIISRIVNLVLIMLRNLIKTNILFN